MDAKLGEVTKIVANDKSSPEMAKKPGWKTSEFYISLATQLIGLLVLTGTLSPEQGTVVTSQSEAIIRQSFALIAVAAPAVAYIYSRAKVKAETKK